MSIAKWRPHIEACKASGLSKAAYAKKQQIDYSQLLYWSKKYEQHNQQRSDLIQVKLPKTDLPICNQQAMGIMEYPNGVKLHIHHPDLLKSLPEWGTQ